MYNNIEHRSEIVNYYLHQEVMDYIIQCFNELKIR